MVYHGLHDATGRSQCKARVLTWAYIKGGRIYPADLLLGNLFDQITPLEGSGALATGGGPYQDLAWFLFVLFLIVCIVSPLLKGARGVVLT